MPTIKGKFNVQLSPLTPSFEGEEGMGVQRLSINKTFEGALAATSTGEMLSVITPTKGSAGYVALEQVKGTLNGSEGSFVLQHSGTMDKGHAGLTVTVVADSGTDALSGLSGTMNIEIEQGEHFYSFTYTLPGETQQA